MANTSADHKHSLKFCPAFPQQQPLLITFSGPQLQWKPHAPPEDWKVGCPLAAYSFSLLVLTTSNQPFPPHHYILAPNSRKSTPRLNQRTLRLPELHVTHPPQHCLYSVSTQPAPNHPNPLSPYPSLQLLQRTPRWIRGLTQAARNQHLTQVEDPPTTHTHTQSQVIPARRPEKKQQPSGKKKKNIQQRGTQK